MKYIFKISRIVREFFLSLFFFKNPPLYCAIRCGFIKKPIVALKMRNGLCYFIRPETNQIRIVDEIWHRKVYDRYLPLLRPDSVVIDIGANVGVFSLKAAHMALRGKVFCFEPEPHNFEILSKNSECNKMSGRVKCFMVAIAENSESRNFYFSAQDSGGGSFYNKEVASGESPIQVKCMTLTDIFTNENISRCDFLKMDCEGAEAAILMSTPPAILSKIATITMEWHDGLSGVTRIELEKFLSAQGFAVDFEPETFTMFCKR